MRAEGNCFVNKCFSEPLEMGRGWCGSRHRAGQVGSQEELDIVRGGDGWCSWQQSKVVDWGLPIGWGKECIPNIYEQRVRPADRRVGYGGQGVMDPGTYREPGIVEARCQKGRDRRLFSEKESRGMA